MKLISSSIIGLLLYFYSPAQSSVTITDINFHTVGLDSMIGKKILVMLLPLQRDTTIINQLLRFQTNHSLQVRIIGLVCWGNSNPSVDSIRTIYQPVINAGVIITQGMLATDSAANERAGVLKWISDMNRSRQAYPLTAGAKYFISEGGRLFAQLRGGNSLDSRLVENIVKTKVPGEHN